MPELFTTTVSAGWNFDNSYCRLPELFYKLQKPGLVQNPGRVIFNARLAESLGLNQEVLQSNQSEQLFAGNQLPQGAEPLAQAYAGHQFGHFTTLGDGRAVLLGEHITPEGQRFDIQLKGAGRTPFSRGGDGRAALGPMLREYIISEAIHHLGIPTTRSLAVVTTGEPVYRETALRGAVLTRVAASHIRIGTFQYASSFGSAQELQALADYTIQRHYPALMAVDDRYVQFLQAVMDRQASLVAQWQLSGFVHGVMNTDNIAISGETIDYGPCAFMDTYDPATVFSSIDRQGRYAYGNQPTLMQWNLARLTEALLPLLHADPSQALAMGQEAVQGFYARYQRYWLAGMRSKLGLTTEESEDESLIASFLDGMAKHQQDFTHIFRLLASDTLHQAPYFKEPAFAEWYQQWQTRLQRQPQPWSEVQSLMNAHNPVVIPRNDRVEAVLSAAVEQQDFLPLQRLLASLESPYTELPQHVEYSLPPNPGGPAYRTFCGT
ncbi:YdiU family protein [Vampirovibrio sp.]|uniref:protein adenylyltransferase SelO n=1 Tax=Vampirovibrio sp. TaxID=2717857 RepID=UPI003593E977